MSFNYQGFNGSDFMMFQKWNGLYSGDKDYIGANKK